MSKKKVRQLHYNENKVNNNNHQQPESSYKFQLIILSLVSSIIFCCSFNDSIVLNKDFKILSFFVITPIASFVLYLLMNKPVKFLDLPIPQESSRSFRVERNAKRFLYIMLPLALWIYVISIAQFLNDFYSDSPIQNAQGEVCKKEIRVSLRRSRHFRKSNSPNNYYSYISLSKHILPISDPNFFSKANIGDKVSVKVRRGLFGWYALFSVHLNKDGIEVRF